MSLPFVHDVFSLPAPFQPILKGSFSSSWRPLSQDCNFLKSTVLSAARGTGLRASQMQGIVSACLLPTRCDQREAQFREVLVFPQAIGCTITLRQWMECSVKSFVSSCEKKLPARVGCFVRWGCVEWLQTCLQQTYYSMLYNWYKISKLSQICTAEIVGTYLHNCMHKNQWIIVTPLSIRLYGCWTVPIVTYTVWLFNIAMENPL